MGFAGLIETSLEYFLGTDRAFDFTVYTSSAKAAIRDVTGYTTNLMVKRHIDDADADALLTASGTVSGTFNSAPGTNTQKISCTLSSSNTDTEIAPGLAHWELKRMDAGAEDVLAYGTIELRRAVHVS
jgi:hypothetical protein